MTLAALVDAGADLTSVQTAIDSMQLGPVRVSSTNVMRNGFRGRLLSIEHAKEHVHRNLRDIHTLVRRARMSSSAKELALRFFERIAHAEAKVHGTTIDRIHFHEVGAIDSIVDMVGVAIAWDSLDIEKAVASPIPTGAGMVRIAHGPVSIPAPATAELLIGVPIAPTQIAMEMTTPTGAAIITELANEFGSMPSMQVGRIGYGAGSKSIPDRPNLLRVLVGDAIKPKPRDSDTVLVMECNLDDVPGEQVGFAIDRLWAAGALDVFTIPIQMKKSRPGILLSVLANPDDRAKFEAILFQQTGTLGVRYRKQPRTVLPRAMVDVSSPWGAVSGKVSKLPTGEVDFSPEYDECCRIASKHGLRLVDVISEIRECYYSSENSRELQQATLSAQDEAEVIPPEENADWESTTSDQSIENVNAFFRQAAIEDEFPDPESPSIEDLGIVQVESDVSPAETTSESPSTFNSPTEVEQNEYFRWDSSPWSMERLAPLPPKKTTTWPET
jgi:pyridinium-3,5-bisthiocarboxylic acid mononucleotide nickel chelatase